MSKNVLTVVLAGALLAGPAAARERWHVEDVGVDTPDAAAAPVPPDLTADGDNYPRAEPGRAEAQPTAGEEARTAMPIPPAVEAEPEKQPQRAAPPAPQLPDPGADQFRGP